MWSGLHLCRTSIWKRNEFETGFSSKCAQMERWLLDKRDKAVRAWKEHQSWFINVLEWTVNSCISSIMRNCQSIKFGGKWSTLCKLSANVWCPPRGYEPSLRRWPGIYGKEKLDKIDFNIVPDWPYWFIMPPFVALITRNQSHSSVPMNVGNQSASYICCRHSLLCISFSRRSLFIGRLPSQYWIWWGR